MLNKFADLRYGNIECQGERKNSSRKQDNKQGKGSVLKIGHLDLHAAELDAPPDVRIGRRWLESHSLPISRLKVLYCLLFSVRHSSRTTNLEMISV